MLPSDSRQQRKEKGMSSRRRRRLWKAEAFSSLAERLRGLEVTLHRRRLLELRCGADAGFGFLLDWLQPSRLVAVDVDASPGTEPPHMGYGPVGAFDAAFLLARGHLRNTLRRISLPAVAHVLAPGGLLVVTTLRPPSLSALPSPWDPEIDRSAAAWGLLHSSLVGAGFDIAEEHLGIDRLLVARRVVAPLREDHVLPAARGLP
jgi:hypothetical protein